VAIKIQYPGIGDALRSDLENVDAVVSTLRAVMRVDNQTMVRDMIGRIAEELDYCREARNQQEFRELWRDDPRVVIPRVFDELCTERVLVTELEGGQSFAELVASDDPARKSAVGEVLFTFVFRSLLRHGIFNADPHPGNYLFGPGNEVVFLDFGCVQRFDAESRDAFRTLITAILEGRRGAELWAILAQTLRFPDGTSPLLREIIEEYVLYCFKPIIDPQPFRYTREYTSQMSELTIQVKMKILKNLLRIGWREPKREGLVLLSRILFGMNSLLAVLGAEADWRALISAA
jgi:predicted unusual protein kinase regulating ubiquinone biosynthesis (AarF/ABC1/UbiB family)